MFVSESDEVLFTENGARISQQNTFPLSIDQAYILQEDAL